jgi:hypothetical protein
MGEVALNSIYPVHVAVMFFPSISQYYRLEFRSSYEAACLSGRVYHNFPVSLATLRSCLTTQHISYRPGSYAYRLPYNKLHLLPSRLLRLQTPLQHNTSPTVPAPTFLQLVNMFILQSPRAPEIETEYIHIRILMALQPSA